MKEYIFSNDDLYSVEMRRYDELKELIRCKDCIYWKRYCRIVNGVTSNHVCGRKRELDGAMHRTKADDFCSWAMRAKE